MEWYDELIRLFAQPEDITVEVIGKLENKKISIVVIVDSEFEVIMFEKIIDDEHIEPEIIRDKLINKINKIKRMNFISLVGMMSTEESTKHKLISMSLDEVKNDKKEN
jgi:hypothetical protein